MFSCGCSGGPPPGFSGPKADKTYLWTRGRGTIGTKDTGKWERGNASCRVAITDGRDRAIEYLKDAGAIAHITVREALFQSPDFTPRLNAVMSKAKVYSSEYTTEGKCEVILRLPRKNLKAIGVTLCIVGDQSCSAARENSPPRYTTRQGRELTGLEALHAAQAGE